MDKVKKITITLTKVGQFTVKIYYETGEKKKEIVSYPPEKTIYATVIIRQESINKVVLDTHTTLQVSNPTDVIKPEPIINPN